MSVVAFECVDGRMEQSGSGDGKRFHFVVVGCGGAVEIHEGQTGCIVWQHAS